MDFTFKIMEGWDIAQLREVRKQLRDILAAEIQIRNSMKAEIMYLQTEVAKYKEAS